MLAWFVIVLFVITLAMVINDPSSRWRKQFPDECTQTNSCSRIAQFNKYRDSKVELVYPMTFKAQPLVLSNIIHNWAISRDYIPIDQTLKMNPNATSSKFIFQRQNFMSIFGYLSDIIIDVETCVDLWGGILVQS